MTNPLTIKDLNCSTCPHNKSHRNTEDGAYWCSLTDGKQLGIIVIGEAALTNVVGCASHPLALSVLTQPVIEELEKEKVKHAVNCFDYGMSKDQHEEHGQFHAYGCAIRLLKGAS